MFQLYLPNNRKQFLKLNMHVINRLYNGVSKITLSFRTSDRRWMVSIKPLGRKSTTRQFAKLKMEIKLNRRLGINETVDHKDCNKQNDDYSNLRILERSIHAKLDAKHHVLKQAICPLCKTVFEVTINQARGRGEGKEKAGPFCSRQCRGKYDASVQNGGKKLERNYIKEYVNGKGMKLK